MYDIVGLESTWVALGWSTWPIHDAAEVQTWYLLGRSWLRVSAAINTGGPVMGADTKGELTLSSGLCCSFTSFPCPQAALVAISGVVLGFGQRWPDIMVLLPLCMFLIVAVWQ